MTSLTDEDRALIEGVAGPMLLKAETAVMEWATLARVISAARSQGPGEGWEPIETAPKDTYGRSLILADRRTVLVGFWDGETWRIDAGSVFSRPTHWRPLPAPPASQIKEG